VAGVGDSGLLIDLEGGPVHLNQELADTIEVRRQ
jgi:hypothetical protein